MHEMGIASSVLDAVRQEAAKHPGSRPARLGLRIGEWAGVDTESLRFCLDAMTRESDLSGLEVQIDYRLRMNRCPRCCNEFRVEDYCVVCPQCQCDQTSPVSGTELALTYIDLEEA